MGVGQGCRRRWFGLTSREFVVVRQRFQPVFVHCHKEFAVALGDLLQVGRRFAGKHFRDQRVQGVGWDLVLGEFRRQFFGFACEFVRRQRVKSKPRREDGMMGGDPVGQAFIPTIINGHVQFTPAHQFIALHIGQRFRVVSHQQVTADLGVEQGDNSGFVARDVMIEFVPGLFQLGQVVRIGGGSGLFVEQRFFDRFAATLEDAEE